MAPQVTTPVIADIKAQMRKGKVVTAEDAVRLIRDGDVVATDGFVGIGFAEEVAIALEACFLGTGGPRDLTLFYAAGQGDGKGRGLNHLAHEGLVKRVIGGHWGLAPELGKLALAGKIQAYNLPQGVISHMFRDIAAHNPRTITRIGLGTFVDPRNGGGKINDVTIDDLVELVSFDGQEYLAYKLFPINYAIIRGTTADMDGNISMEKEALTLEALAIAQATHNSGGFVTVQVERVADRQTLPARAVKIPGILVDHVVVAAPGNHHQTFAVPYNPAFASEIKVPVQSVEPLTLDERKVIARRAAFELRLNAVVNLGIGMPEGVANVANEEGILNYLTLTTEPGTIGGIPAAGLSFGAATNMDALVDQPSQFDFYHGGGLDVAVLGLAQVDCQGNLNVSKFGPKLAGAGGFIDISQSAKRVVFAGTFTGGDARLAVRGGSLHIEQDGPIVKFVDRVEHVTFSARTALMTRKPVLYVTERCVFRLGSQGLELVEVAPGIDIDRDILARMAFRPVIPRQPALMDPRIFGEGSMHLKDDLLSIPLRERLAYDAERNLFFANFEGLQIRSRNEIDEIRREVEIILQPLGRKVRTIVNYDNFSIVPELEDDYIAMLKYVLGYYESVTRYTTSAFRRMKVGDAC